MLCRRQDVQNGKPRRSGLNQLSLSLLLEHRQSTTLCHLCLSLAVLSNPLQLYPSLWIFCCRSSRHVFLGLSLSPLLWRFHFSDCRVMLVAGFRRMCPVPTVSFGSPPLLGVVELSQTTVADHLWPVRKQWLMKLYTFFMDVLVMLHDSVQYRSTVFVKQTYLCASTN